MKEFKIEIEIDENGNLISETKGMTGEICINELEEVLQGLEGARSYKKKPEFYQKNNLKNNNIQKNKF